jgi:hypothetical protein
MLIFHFFHIKTKEEIEQEERILKIKQEQEDFDKE